MAPSVSIRSLLSALGVALLLGGGAAPLSAQPPRLSAESEVSMVTILPGDPVYSMFGHSALRVHDPAQNIDRLYNYGTFDFSDPLFIPKFAYGHLRYFLSVVPYQRALRAYRQQRRPVLEQTLSLTRTQRTALFRVLQVNARPENRHYQYVFFFDNCSTRVRDALEQALGDAVQFGGRPRPDATFRHMLDPYAANLPLVDLSFDLALGTPADRRVTPREAHFLPDYLFEAFAHATVQSGDTTRALVARTDTTQWIDGYEATPTAFPWPLVAGWTILVLTLGWTGWQATTGRRPGGAGDALLLAAVGVTGLLACFLWFVSTYAVTEHNWNLLWAWPTHLIAATVLLWRPSAPGLRTYLAATAVGAVVVALGWTWWPQDLHAAVLPIVLTVGVRTGWRALGGAGPGSARGLEG
ncbi:hypothetical protein GGP80_000039 [Salinibacter ruber]|uniref:Lnb N-terminal periplasmic domain-containing protein n=1 Tax=Salinibacter ruber TaxID=146919 RepID=UPI00161D59CF|nr:DUF4105 domain-containing protein [Salinibacter ruber]MBB4062041.1 hypothetical protein [Salinibacter ruber]MBB4068997.1 hypothetical protein [Salinibacter ruber]MCS3934080.1 hypothetical protein [Salinibacter ruber]MCS4038524.1 hypothetical protein [Salinibacter ruber]MCS4042292.1 hypothetical protein [Salinibacter ruber]